MVCHHQMQCSCRPQRYQNGIQKTSSELIMACHHQMQCFFQTPEVSEWYPENQLRTNNGLPSPDAVLPLDPRGVRMVPAQGETKWCTRELQRWNRMVQQRAAAESCTRTLHQKAALKGCTRRLHQRAAEANHHPVHLKHSWQASKVARQPDYWKVNHVSTKNAETEWKI